MRVREGYGENFAAVITGSQADTMIKGPQSSADHLPTQEQLSGHRIATKKLTRKSVVCDHVLK